jgi:hypothetical protein
MEFVSCKNELFSDELKIKITKNEFENNKEKIMKEKRRCRNFHIQIRGYDVVVKFIYFNKFILQIGKDNIKLPGIKCTLYFDNLKFIGKAICDPRDTYNREEGERIALGKAVIKINMFFERVLKDIKNDYFVLLEDIDTFCFNRLVKYQKQGKTVENDIDKIGC